MNRPVDWKAFEYKFSADPREAFESLAYILFCYEFRQTYGIFRYYNQPYIETQPADTDDGHKIGFQAKYYDAGTSVSSREQDLKDAIHGAKKKYAGIDRLVFYVNKEFSASSAKDKDKPEYQRDIEKYGTRLGIEIQWRVQSHMEKMLAMEELKYVKSLYFDTGTGIDRLHENLIDHKNSILKHIHAAIKYGDKDVKIPRDHQKLAEFQESDSQVLIIHGAAGTGKSATVKDFLQENNKNNEAETAVVFSATDMDVKEENLFLRNENYGLKDLLGLYKNEKYKLCIIDSAEKYTTARYPEVFGDILHQFLDHGWKVLITIRTFYKDSFCNVFLKNYKCSDQEILKLKKETLEELSAQYPFVLPADNRMQDLLCNLFYLNLYLNLDCCFEDEDMTVTLFRDAIWNQVIRNDFQQYNHLPVKREAFVQQMVCDMLTHERYTYSLKATDDFETVSALENSGIIVPYRENRADWMMSHDVYEEIVTNHIFTERLERDIYPGKSFFTDFGNSLRSRKSYRIWLETRLSDGDENILEFLMDVFEDDELGQEWKDETLIALMNSENEEGYFILDTLLNQAGQTLFIKMMILLNTACQGSVDPEILNNLKKQEETDVNPYRYTWPKGAAWKILLNYTYENRDRIFQSEENLPAVTEALYTWTQTEKEGETVRAAGLIALFLRKKIYEETRYKYSLEDNAVYKKLDNIILNAAKEIKPELEDLFGEVLRKKELGHTTEYDPLIKKATSNVMECGMVYAAIPEILIKLLESVWIQPEQEANRHPGLEADFGLKPHLNFRYHPVSALQTPIYLLLVAEPGLGMKFVLELLNYASTCYRNSPMATEYKEWQEIELVISETEKIKQICSERLWKMHRGTAPNPNILECVLMALEKWLLEVAEKFPEILLNKFCLFLLKNSNNVAVTATVLSVVEAYPEKLFDISCVLLRTKEIFHYDISRRTSENTANFLKGYQPGVEVFNRERTESNNRKFRKTTFEQVILNYQTERENLSAEEFHRRMSILYRNIDQTTKDMENWDLTYRYAYYRMDLRCFTKDPEIIETRDRKYVRLRPQMPHEMIELSENAEKEREALYQDQHMELDVWSYAHYLGEVKTYRNYTKYEEQPENAYAEIREILKDENTADDIDGFHDLSVAIYTCAVLLRDFREKLSEKVLTWCEGFVRTSVRQWLQWDNSYLLSNAIDAVLPELIRQVSCEKCSADWENPMFLLVGLLLEHGGNLETLSYVIAEFLWKQDPRAAWKILYTYVHLCPLYREKGQPKGFLDENKEVIEQDLKKEITGITMINTDSLEFGDLLYFHELLNKEDAESFLFIVNTGKKIWGRIFDNDSEENRDFAGTHAYVRWLADYALDLSPTRQRELLQNMMPCISMEETFATWIREMAVCEVRKPRRAAFWNLWDLLGTYIFRKCDERKEIDQSTNGRYSGRKKIFEDLVKNYMLVCDTGADDPTARDFLKHEQAKFYRKAAVRIGYHPAVLYSIAHILNFEGKEIFSKEGVEWLSIIIKNNSHLKKAELPVNTQYYIEEYMNALMKKEKFTLRTDERRRKQVMIVLNFLVERGSTAGFGMREEVI